MDGAQLLSQYERRELDARVFDVGPAVLAFMNRIYYCAALGNAALKRASRIAQLLPWTLALIKGSCDFSLDPRGQRNSWDHQMLMRQLSHASKERADTLAKLRSAEL